MALLLVVIPIGFNAVLLWPEMSLPLPSLNDDATHFMLIQRASEALANGANPIDHWVPELELGFPWFLYYQHLPHLTVILLHRLLLKRVELLTVYKLVRYVLLLGFPLVVYWSMRRMDFSIVAAAVAGAAASLVSADGRYGFEYGSYLWRGFGMYTQLWAVPLSFITLACLDRLLDKGKGYGATVVAFTLLALSHILYAYMMAISALVLLLVGLRRANAAARLGRLAVAGALVAVITSYMSLPFYLGKAYLATSPYLQRWKYDSYGAQEILKWLVEGDLLDFDRLPVLTLLLALGVAGAVLTRARPARIALALFVVWLPLYFGRPTWGRLVDILPMHDGLFLHRFSGSVHLAAILLIGLGGEWLWRQLAPLPERPRVAALAGLVLVLLVPAFQERHGYYALNTQWMERARNALAADADARAILETLRGLPPGRTHAGLRVNWGKELRFGDLHFYDLLTFHRIVAVSPPYTGITLNADLIWHFDDHNPGHYDLLDVKYLVAPRTWSPPDFLRPIKETRRYVLYEAPTRGYGELVGLVGRVDPSSQANLFVQNRNWFLSPDPAAGRFVRYDFPPGKGAAAAVPATEARAGCPDGGRTSDERVSPGRIELQAECSAPSTLVLKVTYHPNWRVRVDGREAQPFMVSPSFIGVELPAGRHQILAEYRPAAYRTVLLLLGLATLVAMFVVRRRFEGLDAVLRSAQSPWGAERVVRGVKGHSRG